MSSAKSALVDVAPVYIDTTRASIARVYDAFLNGKDNYEIDREVFRRVQRVAPEAALLARDNREFLIRVTRFIAGQTGITQYLDCGSGLPTAENTHQVARRIQPESRVVYIDIDPVVLAHGRALLEDNEDTHFVAADIFRPEEVIENAQVLGYLELDEPIALFQLGTLHHYDGERCPADIMRCYIEALPSGSYVAISHFFDPETPEQSELARRLEEAFVRSSLGTGRFRTRAEIEAMFAGLDLIEPGITRCAEWWPDGPRIRPLDPVQHCIVGGVARKP
ncbi:MAG TPA: SAM-dependent methyltransferase [Actinophytocola sp.]|uniref:SAM-dependent methyltransferase n=1 Tax=Actinophytocola sp. TaxID=1872138 RepID=UPI002DB5E1F6|nr:SAM-dependent methyltransferase [Actinophytocola sp.]HEU5469346.1 SAM-dependent methyltransferase [Actinophytocola sp.]